MINPGFCAGCAPNLPDLECQGCFKRLGIIKVHWECWSECNLACPFCYRTRGIPLDTEEAKKLIEAVSKSGATIITFAGGDPSIRPDIIQLISYAHTLGVQVEVQTNSHHLKSDFIEALEKVELVGMSLDGPDANTHDSFRNKPGNFNRVMTLLRTLSAKEVPLIVRTIVAKPNNIMIPRMANLLEEFSNIIKWSLMEFSPVGEGFFNCERYKLDRDVFDKITDEVKKAYKGSGQVDVYRTESKLGTYVIITPHGYMYGTTQPAVNGVYPTIGSILRQHLVVLAEKHTFSKENHILRYSKDLLHTQQN